MLHDEFAKKSFKNWKGNIINVIRPMNLAFVRELLLKAQKVEHTIQGKDVVLLLGVTGAGKSTTVNFLAGKEMQEVTIGSDLTAHIQPLDPPGLKGIYDSLGLNLDYLDSVHCAPR